MECYEKFLKINLLIVEINKIMINIEAMKAFNQWRISRDESPGYSESDFFDEIEKLEAMAKAMEQI